MVTTYTVILDGATIDVNLDGQKRIYFVAAARCLGLIALLLLDRTPAVGLNQHRLSQHIQQQASQIHPSLPTPTITPPSQH
jgi:hypothetical protein